MNIVPQSVEFKRVTPDALELIEEAARTCYKSEDRIGPGTAEPMVRRLIKMGHESPLEHASVTFRIICDRGVSHELVRHRLCSFSQESTRYVTYGKTDKLHVENDDAAIDYYIRGMSMRRISELSEGKYTEWDIYKLLDAHEIARRPRGNKGIIHADFFDTIDTHEKAYLLGLIQADGSVRDTGSPQITITQHKSKSWYIKRMLRDFIKPSGGGSTDGDCDALSFTSPKLHAALIAKGVVPNKSYVQTAQHIDLLWSSLPAALVPSFLRGFLDGDGSIRFFRQNNPGSTDSCNVSWAGNEHLLAKISSWLSVEFNYKATAALVSGTSILYRIAVTQPDVGEAVVRRLLCGFRFPYGNPVKTARMLARVGGIYPIACIGASTFKFILPPGIMNTQDMWIWLQAMEQAEFAYLECIESGQSPQIVRSVLPNSLKTELVMTTNFREWRTIMRQRLSAGAHPQMKEVMRPIWDWFNTNYPVIVEDILP